MHSTKAPKKAQKSAKRVQTKSKRSIISYTWQTTPTQERKYARSAIKGGEQPPLNFVPRKENFQGLTSTTLPDGKTVQIFRPPTGVQRQFAYSSNYKHPRSHLNVTNASAIIHSIATKVAQTKPLVIGESSLIDMHSNHVSNINNLTPKDFQNNSTTNHIIRLSPPTFMKPAMYNTKHGPKSVNQAKRWQGLIQKRSLEIKQQKQAFQSHLEILASYVPIPTDVKSTQETPLDFSGDLGLKFRVIDAVIKHTKIQVPAHKLGAISNVTELVDFIVEKRNELEAKSSIRKNQERLPENVTFIYTNKIERKKGPKWIKYKELREKAQVATAE